MRTRRMLLAVLIAGVALVVGLTVELVAVLPGGSRFDEWAIAAISLVGGLVPVGAGFLLINRRYERRDRRQVFVSYAHEDQQHAARVAAAVSAAGYNPWLDSAELLPGQNVKKTIEEAIRQSGAALFIAPPEGLRSPQRFEMERLLLQDARGLSRRVSAVVPVVVNPDRARSVPAPLNELQWISLENPDWEMELSRYLRAAFK